MQRAYKLYTSTCKYRIKYIIDYWKICKATQIVYVRIPEVGIIKLPFDIAGDRNQEK